MKIRKGKEFVMDKSKMTKRMGGGGKFWENNRIVILEKGVATAASFSQE